MIQIAVLCEMKSVGTDCCYAIDLLHDVVEQWRGDQPKTMRL